MEHRRCASLLVHDSVQVRYACTGLCTEMKATKRHDIVHLGYVVHVSTLSSSFGDPLNLPYLTNMYPRTILTLKDPTSTIFTWRTIITMIVTTLTTSTSRLTDVALPRAGDSS